MSSILAAVLVIGGLSVVGPAIPAGASTSVTPDELLAALTVQVPSSVPYDRDRFAEGIDADSNGCNTRREVLISESLVPVTISGACNITAGQWFSWYEGATQTDPAQLEMDHLVALKEAWISGAHRWTDSQRSDYANDLVLDATLTVVTGMVNGSKGSHDPATWIPSLESSRCQYAADWITVKYRWHLSVDMAEKQALENLLTTYCNGLTIDPPPVRSDIPDPRSTTAGVTELPAGTYRLAGADRYETAVRISERFSPQVPIVYVATGSDYPDALSASALAGAQGGPLLLVKTNSIPASVMTELQRLSPKAIVIAGGNGAVSQAVERILATVAPTIRKAGADRYGTSRQLAESVALGGSSVFIATGSNFPDALSATAAAGSLGSPVMLVNGAKSSIDGNVRASLMLVHPSSVHIAGGTAVVSSGIESDLRAAYPALQRHGGTDRYSTGVEINSAIFDSASTVYLATGTGFADALAGGALAAATGSPLFIVRPDCVPQGVRTAIDKLYPQTIVLLGGTGVLNSRVASLTVCATVAPPAPPESPTTPANPGNSKNCTDFATWEQAQSWYLKYFPYYGDVAVLDADHDGIACESLPGAPE